jgi:integrase
MASLYRDPKSPFWYLRKKGSNGKWKSVATRYRHGIASETRKAREECAAASLEESRFARRQDAWATWVPDYLKTRYSNTDTRRRALNAWGRLSEYFTEQKIHAPQNVTYRTCMDYLPWRKRKAAHNTALLELKILGVVCEEAKRRGIISANPALRLGIAKERGKEKPELTDDNIKTIRTALRKEQAWMRYAFEIALHQGCRLSETNLFRDDVDLQKNVIHFRKTKGDKPFTVPLNPALKPKLHKLLRGKSESDADRLFRFPANAARDFHRFHKKLGIKGVTFHSTRVTVASRLARRGYPLAKAMRLLNHSSELIHRSYQRLQAEDVADAYEHLSFPTDKK